MLGLRGKFKYLYISNTIQIFGLKSKTKKITTVEGEINKGFWRIQTIP